LPPNALGYHDRFGQTLSTPGNAQPIFIEWDNISLFRNLLKKQPINQ